MNLNSENKQAVHDVLIADMQQRLHEGGKGTGEELFEIMVL